MKYRNGRLAEEIRAEWLRRYPKDPYSLAGYDAIASGFRRTILGFPVDGPHKNTAR